MAGRKKRQAKHHPGEVICQCDAYDYPHRVFSGRCTFQRWVEEFFDPFKSDCLNCTNRDGRDCQCISGIEEPTHCPELRLHIRYEGIRLLGQARIKMERSTCAR